jgi:hypothetical protein
MKNSTNLLRKIETIEKEVMNLKLSVLRDLSPSRKKLISLKGILKGIEVTDQDIARVQKSLYSKTGI